MTDEPFDIADAEWSSLSGDKAQWIVVYQDRKLTRWEWIKVHVFRRPNPLIIFSGAPDDPGVIVQNGESFTIEFGDGT